LPQARWILGWWVRVWGGMLLAQSPSVFALSIGTQLLTYSGGFSAFVFSIAFLQLACDVYSVIPFGNTASGTIPWAFSSGTLDVTRLAKGGLGGAAGGLAVAAGTVAAGAASSRVGGQTYGYQ